MAVRINAELVCFARQHYITVIQGTTNLSDDDVDLGRAITCEGRMTTVFRQSRQPIAERSGFTSSLFLVLCDKFPLIQRRSSWPKICKSEMKRNFAALAEEYESGSKRRSRGGSGLSCIELPAAQSYGGVLLSLDGRVLLREPIDHLDGYVWTWPKGKPERGENPAQTALREVHEETGYRARIIGSLPRVYIGTTRTNAFFLMEPIGEPGPIINETAQIRWVSYKEAYRLITYNKHEVGRSRDRAILDDALHLWSCKSAHR